jgi:hypothetical protein
MAKLTVNESSGDFTHVLTLSAQDIVNASTNQTIIKIWLGGESPPPF